MRRQPDHDPARLDPAARASLETAQRLAAATREPTRPLDAAMRTIQEAVVASSRQLPPPDEDAWTMPGKSLPEIVAETRARERRQLAENIAEALVRRRRAGTAERRRAAMQAALRRTPAGRQVLENLSPREQAVFPYYDQRPVRVALRLGLSPATVRAAMYRIEQKLRAAGLTRK
jgi:DNA-binding CsgD family transcriptional regulator